MFHLWQTKAHLKEPITWQEHGSLVAIPRDHCPIFAANCTSFSLSGLGEADGIYTEQHRSETHYRASRGGVEPYEIEDNSYDDFWWIQRSADYEYNLKYRVGRVEVDEVGIL